MRRRFEKQIWLRAGLCVARNCKCQLGERGHGTGHFERESYASSFRDNEDKYKSGYPGFSAGRGDDSAGGAPRGG
ncbi:pentatricopeptide repeat-containing protein mitochondrial-like [Dorcoceras hygrometricum]|uniref:Pentatricopeptide repeat-containing protein mitochondrial-like n=1 Tax=Dorcoceras hygrometricum TaxID=472368 RepID=A0A2Z7D8R5_9LAMI|nr:pentatricopeptide repeat-containing protein mitochondrial-like [Dorcoceras hygrometricum]